MTVKKRNTNATLQSNTPQKLYDVIVNGATIQEVSNHDLVQVDYYSEGSRAGQVKKVVISDFLVLQLLRNEGYRKIYTTEGDKQKAVLVKITDNIIEPATIEQCQNLIGGLMLSNFKELKIRDEWQKKSKSIINDITLNSLNEFFTPNWVRDTKEDMFFFFKNGIVRASPKGINLEDYSTITGYVWRSQTIKHDFIIQNQDEFNTSDYWSFLSDICSTREGKQRKETDEDRFKALLSVIGYYLHKYKNSAKAKAVIFSEANLNMESQEGRSGKGLILEAIGHLRNVTLLDYKNFSFEDRFKWQDIEIDTDIVLLDEADSKFPFRSMFSAITNSLKIEKKSKQSIVLPFKTSPKFSITTNEIISNEGGSARDRRFDMELLPFYDSDFKPTDKYDKLFFSEEWSSEEWNKFYNCLVFCGMFYLSNNRELLSYESDTMYERKLLGGTSEAFRDWVESEGEELLKPSQDWRCKAKAYEEYYYFCFQDTPPTKEEIKKGAKPRVGEKTFWGWVNTFCKLNNYHYEIGRKRIDPNQVELKTGKIKAIQSYLITEK